MKRGFGNNNFRRIAMALIAAVITFGASSCLRDDIEPCPDPFNVYLRVTTDYEKGGSPLTARNTSPAPRPWYENAINNVVIFVFDDDENIVEYWQGGAYILNQSLEVPFILPDGKKYHFVAGTNIGEGRSYNLSHSIETITGAPRVDLSVNIDLPADRILTSDIEHRHYGELDDQYVEVGMDKDNYYEIVMEPHTYKVNFIIAGMDPGDDVYQVDVSDTNCHHDFWCNHMTGMSPYTHRRTMVHETPTRADNSRVKASANLLQINDATETLFELSKTVTTVDSEGKTSEKTSYYPETNVLEAIKLGYKGILDDIKLNNYVENPNMSDDEALAILLGERFEYNIVMKLANVGLTFQIMEWNYMDNTGSLE